MSELDLADLRRDIRWWTQQEENPAPHEREHVDRPAWAYCEDGYCVDCGNGKWKAHNTWCEIAYLIDRAVAAGDPLYGVPEIETWLVLRMGTHERLAEFSDYDEAIAFARTLHQGGAEVQVMTGRNAPDPRPPSRRTT